MNRFTLIVLASLALTACSGDGTNPFDADDTTDTTTDGTGGDTGNPIDSDRTLPPGTAAPSPSTAIFRTEPLNADDGSGYVASVTRSTNNDTLTVDGLAFDGNNVYTRGNAVSQLGPFAVYEGAETHPDSLTGQPVDQLTHRALYGVSPSGNLEFTIVRTGSYVGYGFGGFIYQRNGTVVLPTSGQATYSGDYAGIRDFNGQSGIEYATGDMSVSIDFDDFNNNGGTSGAVRGSISNRRVFDINGNDVTQSILDALEAENDLEYTALPTIRFRVGPGALDVNGEITGTLTSSIPVADVGLSAGGGAGVITFEEGTYYAIVSGDNADEILGVVVMENSADPRVGGTVRETGGFIVARQP